MILTNKDFELKKIISKGNVLYIKQEGMYEPYLSMIQDIKEDILSISVQSAFFKNGVSAGDSIMCQILEGEYEYVIQGEIKELVINHPGIVRFTIEKVSKYKNNRVFKRYAVNFKAAVDVVGSTNSVPVMVKNISIIGAGIECKEFIHITSIVTIRIKTFISNELLELKARIVRGIKNEETYDYGLEIIDISDVNKDILDKLMFYLNTNENTFIEDLMK